MEGRNERGQFTTGHKHSVGNKGGRPRRAREERYAEIMLSTCSFADWRKIVQVAVRQALEGDHRARAWLTDRLLGTVTSKLEARIDMRETLNDDLEQALGRILGADTGDEDGPSAD